MIPGLGGLMKQAKEMQEKMGRMQEELAARSFSADAGGGMVEVTVNGKQEVLNVRIDQTALGDTEVLEDLIRAATNNAIQRSQEAMKEELAKLTGGLALPGIGNLLGGLGT